MPVFLGAGSPWEHASADVKALVPIVVFGVAVALVVCVVHGRDTGVIQAHGRPTFRWSMVMLAPTDRERSVAGVVRVGGDSIGVVSLVVGTAGSVNAFRRRRCFRVGRSRARACAQGTEKVGASATRCRSCKKNEQQKTASGST